MFTPQNRMQEKPSIQTKPPAYSNLAAKQFNQANSRNNLVNTTAKVRMPDNYNTIQANKETAQKLVFSNSNSGLNTIEQ